MLFQNCGRSTLSLPAGLVLLATITITAALLSPSGVRASQYEAVQPRGLDAGRKPGSAAKEEEQALAGFLDTYRLAPGQNLKRIQPPRPNGIRVWYERKEPRLHKPQDSISARAIVFNWRDPDQLRVSSWMFGRSEGCTIRELPQWLMMVFHSYDIEGDPEILKTEVSGDWIVREGVPDEQLVRPLEAILQRAIRRRITLAIRRVERDVVVARGRYRPSPLPGHADGEIEVYAREVGAGDHRGEGVGIFTSFLHWTAERIGRPIVNEVESPPKTVTWHYNGREASNQQTPRPAHDVALVLRHLHEQTGLTFAREKRVVPVLFVERPAAK
jgi:hypothetical protein